MRETHTRMFAQASMMKTKVMAMAMMVARSSGEGQRSDIQAMRMGPTALEHQRIK